MGTPLEKRYKGGIYKRRANVMIAYKLLSLVLELPLDFGEKGGKNSRAFQKPSAQQLCRRNDRRQSMALRLINVFVIATIVDIVSNTGIFIIFYAGKTSNSSESVERKKHRSKFGRKFVEY